MSHILKLLQTIPTIRSNPIFASVILKLINKKTRQFIFKLLTTHIKVDYFVGKDEDVKESFLTLKNLNLLKIQDNQVLLDNDFLSGLYTAMKTLKINRIFDCIRKNENEIRHNDIFNDILRILVIDNSATKINHKKMKLIKSILLFSNLIKNNSITHTGFSFLLQSKKEQIWFIILNGIDFLINEYDHNQKFNNEFFPELDHILAPEFDKILQFDNSLPIASKYKQFLLLAFFEIGIFGNSFVKPKFNFDLLSQFINFLECIGILYLSDNHHITQSENFFDLFSVSVKKDKFLIIETNYKLYSLNCSDYEVSVINLFSNIIMKLPNLIVSFIDEQSINKALDKGITAKQINDYLLNKSIKQINPIILEQISIWEKKRFRIKCNNAVIYSHFMTFNEYEKVLSFCKRMKYILDFDNDKRVIVVSSENHHLVKNFIKENIK